MSLRLQEMHPILVHLPIALLPLAIGADLLGRASDDASLMNFGRQAMGVAAVGAIAAAATGLIAGEEVNVEGEARDMLMTHRNLNFVATVLTTSLSVWRAARQRPNAAYLTAGLAGIGMVGYTAYLGGKIVYSRGAGVEPAGGVYRPDAPALGTGRTAAFFEAAANDLVQGVRHMVQEIGQGKLAPTLVAWFAKRGAGGGKSAAV